MIRLFRAAAVIARRDYVATVWSRTFLLFLIGPLLPLVFGAAYGAIAASQEPPHDRSVRVAMSPTDLFALVSARETLATRLGDDALPRLSRAAEGDDQAVLSGSIDAPVLDAPGGALHRLSGRLGLILDRARADRALGRDRPPPAVLATHARDAGRHDRPADDDREDLARGGQFVLFFLTMMLAGMTISNLVEEKSNKVIELLAAAVPVDAIFLGKLVAMLGVSLTGLLVWTSAGAVAMGFLPPQLMPATPAVGWPAYVLLGVLYFASVYLLIGALYLGVGAQAASVREVQTISMPLTMAQLVIFGLASAAVTRPDRPLALIADILPWTSPFAMFARAAMRPRLWPHALALAWQLVALAVMIRMGARLFRRNVLKSGRGARS